LCGQLQVIHGKCANRLNNIGPHGTKWCIHPRSFYKISKVKKYSKPYDLGKNGSMCPS
jgi:hypothetical protein